MRAVLFEAPGKVRPADGLPRPAPANGEVLVQVDYAGLCGSNMDPYLGRGLWRETQWPAPPGWMGHENVGVVAESRDPRWTAGTPVLAQPKDYNGFLEFFIAHPGSLQQLPAGAGDAARFVAAQPLATVLRALDRVGPLPGRCCAVVGQGPIGLMFTNRLREGGVDRVIAIDRVPWRLQWARRMGATDVVDASRRDTMGAVRELTSGAMVDLCVEAVGTEEALCTAAFLPRRGGKLCVFGVPQTDSQRFPWFHTTGNETEIVTSRGAGWMDYAGTAVHMVAGDGTGLADLVTPRLPWDRAAEAFEMYANPARHEGTLKLVLEF